MSNEFCNYIKNDIGFSPVKFFTFHWACFLEHCPLLCLNNTYDALSGHQRVETAICFLSVLNVKNKTLIKITRTKQRSVHQYWQINDVFCTKFISCSMHKKLTELIWQQLAHTWYVCLQLAMRTWNFAYCTFDVDTWNSNKKHKKISCTTY